jgi:large subunit ribosomal protein L21
MFAVIRTGGKQYRVQEGDILEVEKLRKKEGQKVVFKEVLLVEDGDSVLLGTPLVDKAQVKAEVVENFKDEKIIIFKKKRRKQYRRTTGHRQELTRVKIEQIIAEAKAPAEKPKVKKKEEEKTPKRPKAKEAKASKTPEKKQKAAKKAPSSRKVTRTKE